MFCKLAILIQDKTQINDSNLAEIEEIIMDKEIAQSIIDAAKASMGSEFTDLDHTTIQALLVRIGSQFDFRSTIQKYLKDRMDAVAPNMTKVVGEQIGAKLIQHSGSLSNLIKYPASTVQILGAEKALFQALKTKSNTPKYGLIYNSSFIGRAGGKDKGKISRYLANKISIASRLDYFLIKPTDRFGSELHKQVENRLG